MNLALAWIKEAATTDRDDCMMWPFGRFADGYGAVDFNGKKHRAHRLMCLLVHGDPGGPKDAAHSCGNGHRGCVNPRHLRWASRRENIEDAIAHGTWPRGEKRTNAKLTNNQAVEVLALRGKGLSQREVGERYGVSRELVRAIWQRKAWQWLH